MDRTKEIVKVSIRGIAVNIILVVFKAAVGLAANSVAVILDAVNNLSDALSSVITIVGTKLAGKAADKKHPYGYGRIEYITSTIIAVIVITAGITSLKESVMKIIAPEDTNYTAVSLIIIGAGVLVKFFLGRYFTAKGKALNSGSLTASGTDASFDAVISLATFVSAVISMTAGLNLEGILGAVISVFILKAGVEVIIETLGDIIGVRADEELTAKVKEKVCSYEGILGAYDLILNSYGPQENLGSVHVEVADDMTARDIDALTRRIVPEIYTEYGVLLTIGIYASNTGDELSARIKEAVRSETAAYPQILQMHGFYCDPEKKLASFDIIIDFNEHEKLKITEDIRQKLSQSFPDISFYINIDRDFSD